VEDPEFAQFVDMIRDGAGLQVSLAMLTTVEEVKDIIHFVYLPDNLQNTAACLKRLILTPTNCQVNVYNTTILSCINGEQHMYMAANSLKVWEKDPTWRHPEWYKIKQWKRGERPNLPWVWSKFLSKV
jgi:hypothetical protein